MMRTLPLLGYIQRRWRLALLSPGAATQSAVAFLVSRKSSKCPSRSEAIIQKSDTFLAPNYLPLPVVVDKAKGVHVYDVDGREYLDFFAGHATVSLGHCNPKLTKAAVAQCKKLTISPRAYHSKSLTAYAEYMTQLLCYDQVLPTTTGSEAVEAAVKMARKWGYKVKGICEDQAVVLFPKDNAWGTSIAGLSTLSDQIMSRDMGPLCGGFDTVPYNNAAALMEKIREPNVCAFVFEPIQCHAGVIIPDMTYMKKVRDMCTDNNVLMIADERECGVGRAGSLLCSDLFQVRPDVVILGKGLTGGIMPISAVFTDKDVMSVLGPGNHVSTFGGSPIGCRIAMAVLKEIDSAKLCQNSRDLGAVLREELCDLPREVVTDVRGMGLLNAIVVHEDVDACDLSLGLLKCGLLTHPVHNQIIRLTPPLTIKEKDVLRACQIIRKCVCDLRPPDKDDVSRDSAKARLKAAKKKSKKKSKSRKSRPSKCSVTC